MNRAAILLMLAATQGACSPDRPPAPPSQAIDGTIVIRMTDDMIFSPSNVTVSVGDTVAWVNDGVLPHTSSDSPGLAAVDIHNVLPDGATPWDSGTLASGERFSVVFDRPGDYTYLCRIHETAGMVGTLTVTARSDPD